MFQLQPLQRLEKCRGNPYWRQAQAQVFFMDLLLLAPRAAERAEAGQGREDRGRGTVAVAQQCQWHWLWGSASSSSHHATGDTEMFTMEAGICSGPPWVCKAGEFLLFLFTLSLVQKLMLDDVNLCG